MRVLCVGGLHVDVKARVDGAVVPGTSNPASVTRTPGGVATNVARTLVRLGVGTGVVSLVGDDASGSGLTRLLADEGIDPAGVAATTAAATASYLAVLDGEGSLAVGVADMAVYQHMTFDWLDAALDAAPDADAWMVDTNLPAGTIAALVARADGRPVVADPVSVDKARRLAGVLGRIDRVFPDRAEAEVLAGAEPGTDPAAMARAIPCPAAISLGADGMWADGEVHPAIAPEVVVDVTGAGDAGVAGWLWAMLGGTVAPVAAALAASSLAVESAHSVRPDLDVPMLMARLGM